MYFPGLQWLAWLQMAKHLWPLAFGGLRWLSIFGLGLAGLPGLAWMACLRCLPSACMVPQLFTIVKHPAMFFYCFLIMAWFDINLISLSMFDGHLTLYIYIEKDCFIHHAFYCLALSFHASLLIVKFTYLRLKPSRLTKHPKPILIYS